jgi:hypothetical protein
MTSVRPSNFPRPPMSVQGQNLPNEALRDTSVLAPTSEVIAEAHRELAGHPSARDRGVGNCRQALPGDVIDDVEKAEAARLRRPDAIHQTVTASIALNA